MGIDTHLHILPFFDDGPRSLADSLQMGTLAQTEGIHTMIATPHHLTRKFYNHRSDVEQAVLMLNQNLRKEGLDLTVLPGQEVRMNPVFFKEWEEGSVITLNHSRYILIEFETNASYDEMQEWIHELQMLNLVPIIAHPERIEAVIHEPRRLEELILSGALCQATCLTIAGHFGRKAQKTAERLCRNHWIHLLASDAHDSVERACYWTQALGKLNKWAGVQWSRYVLENAKRIVHDQPIEVSTSHFTPRKKYFLFRR